MSYLAKNYNRKKISFVKGKGSYLYTATGSRYLDFVQGIAVNCLGHAHPKLVKTVKKQSKKFLEGKSPPDFAAEDYEINYKGRVKLEDLSSLAKKQLALEEWN